MRYDKPVKPGTLQAEQELARRWDEHIDRERRAGAAVKRWRIQRGLSQRQLANALSYQGLNMHQTTIAKLEKGKRPLRLAELDAICDVLGCSMSDVL